MYRYDFLALIVVYGLASRVAKAANGVEGFRGASLGWMICFYGMALVHWFES